MTRSLLSPGAQTSLRQRVTCYLPRCVLGPVCPAGPPPHFRRYHQWVLISHRLLFCRWSHEIKLHSQGCLVFDDTGWSQWPQTLGGVPGSLGLGTSRLPREAAFLWHLEVNWLRGRKVGGEGDFSDWEPRPVFGRPTAQRCWLVAGGWGVLAQRAEPCPGSSRAGSGFAVRSTHLVFVCCILVVLLHWLFKKNYVETHASDVAVSYCFSGEFRTSDSW